MKSPHRLLGSSVNPTELSLTIKGILLTLIPVVIMIAAGLGFTLNTDDLTSFVNTLFAISTSCITLWGLGRKIYYQFKK